MDSIVRAVQEVIHDQNWLSIQFPFPPPILRFNAPVDFSPYAGSGVRSLFIYFRVEFLFAEAYRTSILLFVGEAHVYRMATRSFTVQQG